MAGRPSFAAARMTVSGGKELPDRAEEHRIYARIRMPQIRPLRGLGLSLKGLLSSVAYGVHSEHDLKERQRRANHSESFLHGKACHWIPRSLCSLTNPVPLPPFRGHLLPMEEGLKLWRSRHLPLKRQRTQPFYTTRRRQAAPTLGTKGPSTFLSDSFETSEPSEPMHSCLPFNNDS